MTNTQNIFQLLKANIKILLATLIGSAIVAFAASSFIPKKYKSTAVVFPANISQSSEESPTEQLLQFFLSEDIKWQIAKDFKLYENYDIDSTSMEGAKNLFNYAWSENISISPTLYESIEINVKDKDPKLAQKIAQAIIAKTNVMVRESKRKIVQQYYTNSQKVINIQKREIDSLEKIMAQLALSKDENKDVKKILRDKIKATLKAYEKIKVINDTYLLDVDNNNDYVSTVSSPSLADKHCYPIKSIVVAISALFSTLFAALLIIIFKK
ncbi:MAG: hypothetical protein IM600_11050 [Bacteroidetes bacterium]|nr:hypothetical protein [Bacteroidota bacterium]MCA6443956.1 hypothetical protein [Bacteroidota bacterium]